MAIMIPSITHMELSENRTQAKIHRLNQRAMAAPLHYADI